MMETTTRSSRESLLVIDPQRHEHELPTTRLSAGKQDENDDNNRPSIDDCLSVTSNGSLVSSSSSSSSSSDSSCSSSPEEAEDVLVSQDSLHHDHPAQPPRRSSSVLILGGAATEALGRATVHQLAAMASSSSSSSSVIGDEGDNNTTTTTTTTIYGMSHNLACVPQETMEVYSKHAEALIEGDATRAEDVHRALLLSQADTIVLVSCSGSGATTTAAQDEEAAAVAAMSASSSCSSFATDAGRAILQVLRHCPFRHVRLIVVSWAKAQPTECHDEEDHEYHHDCQTRMIRNHAALETLIKSDFTIRDRTTILRPPSNEEAFSRLLHQQLPASASQSGALKQLERCCRRNRKGGARHAPTRCSRPVPTLQLSQSEAQCELAKYLGHEIIHGQHKGMIVNMPSTIIQC
ncbi:hypothetical protein ACA910_014890 [Epithemia clementina (nom. ined.)]